MAHDSAATKFTRGVGHEPVLEAHFGEVMTQDANGEIFSTTVDPAGTGSPGGKSVLRFSNVVKAFRSANGEEIRALNGVDLEIREGEFTTLIGPSGCGKSTLLNMACGLLQPDAGEAYFNNRPIQRVNTDAGYVTQDSNLLPWKTVEPPRVS